MKSSWNRSSVRPRALAKRQRLGVARHAHQIEGLQVAAVRARGLQAQRLELRRDVLLGQRVAPGGRAPALEQVRGEEADVGPEVSRLDAPGSGLLRQRRGLGLGGEREEEQGGEEHQRSLHGSCAPTMT